MVFAREHSALMPFLGCSRGLALIFVWLLMVPHCKAFNADGHRLIALIAWQELDVATRDKMLSILRHHPRFQQDFEIQMPSEVRTASQTVKNRWLFLQASAWAEMPKRFSGRTRMDFHRPNWHHVRFPILARGMKPTELRLNTASDLPPQAESVFGVPCLYDYDTELSFNILQAYELNRVRLTSETIAADHRALSLCWVLHLVGDSHQPLNATSLFSPNRFPNGDDGGRRIEITRGGSFHAYWDGLLGSDQDLSQAARFAMDPKMQRIGKDAASDLTIQGWLDESRVVSQAFAYRPVLGLVELRETTKGEMEPLQLSPEYDRQAFVTAKRRAVRAGYRMSELLKRYLISGSVETPRNHD